MLRKALGIILVQLLVSVLISGQTVVWHEDFSGYPNQTTQAPNVGITTVPGVWAPVYAPDLWATVANDSDDPAVNVGSNFWGTYNGRFRCNDIEGQNNDDQNFLTTKFFDISTFAKVSVYGDYQHEGPTECGNSNSRDIIGFTYSIDGGAIWVQFENNGFICGDNRIPGTSSSHCIEGDSIALRIQMSNKANDENSYIDNLIIEGYNPPSVIFPNDTGICGADSIPLTIKNGTAYRWTGADSFSCDTCQSTLAYARPGSYIYMTAYDSAGCPNEDSIFISTHIPSIDLGEDTVICNGQKITLSAKFPSSSGRLWSNGKTSDTIEVRSSGKYWVEIQSACGVFSDTIVVDSVRYPNAYLGRDTTFCNDSWTLNLKPEYGESFLWNTGDTSPQITVNSKGVYAVEVETVCGSDYDTIIVDQQSPPQIQLPFDTTLCKNEVLTLANSERETQYLWADGDTTPAVRVKESGYYRVTAINKCGQSTEEIYITMVDTPNVNVDSFAVICQGDSIQLTVETPETDFVWSTGMKDSVITVTQPGLYTVRTENVCGIFHDTVRVEMTDPPQHTLNRPDTLCEGDRAYVEVDRQNQAALKWYDGSERSTRIFDTTGQYWFTLQNLCGTVTDTVKVFFSKYPEVNFGKDTLLCKNEQFILRAPEHQRYRYEWNTGANSSEVTVRESGFYAVTVTNPHGCVVEDEINIKSCDIKIYIPNAFSPNGDGVNDVFSIESVELDRFWVRIFDRWGKELYFSDNPDFQWDGIYRGKPVTQGVYTYRMWYRKGQYESEEKTGIISVIK